MNMRWSRLAMSVLAVAAVVLTTSQCWAVFFPLGPSKDDWGLRFDVETNAVENDKVNVRFTLADEGRLKSIHSATVVALSKPDASGGRSYDVKARIDLKPTKDGKRVGQVQIPQQFAGNAVIRILTLTVDGRHQSQGAAYYDIPLSKYLTKTAAKP